MDVVAVGEVVLEPDRPGDQREGLAQVAQLQAGLATEVGPLGLKSGAAGQMGQLLEGRNIKTVCLRRPGAAKGARLVHLASLLDYLHANVETLGEN
jgi:hypothetical protein